MAKNREMRNKYNFSAFISKSTVSYAVEDYRKRTDTCKASEQENS